MINSFDWTIISFLNQFARRSWTFDRTTDFITFSNLLKGGVLTPIIWWAWFAGTGAETQRRRRRIVLGTLLAAVLALVVARGLAITLPYRIRPLHRPDIHFVIPHHASMTYLKGWSSFPSDHAALFFGLASGIMLISRRWGALLFAYVLGVICLPRVYLGLHYPTDIIAGAFIGVAITYLVNHTSAIQRTFSDRLITLSERRPGLFYAGLFLVTFQFASLFHETRELGNFGLDTFQSLVRVISRGSG